MKFRDQTKITHRFTWKPGAREGSTRIQRKLQWW